MIRSPLLPFSELTAWGEGTSSRALWEKKAPAESLEQAWAHDARLLRDRLLRIIERCEIQHALYVASTPLQLGIESWKRNPGDKKGLHAERALVRYFFRMAGRSTPFGLFSGFSTGQLTLENGATASLALAGRDDYRLSCRLDFDYLTALTTALQRNRSIAEALLYWPNASLHRIGNAWHYVESRVGAERSHHLVKVEADEYVNAALDAASRSATFTELVAAVSNIAEPEVTPQQVIEYTHDLIAQNILGSSLEPRVTGEPALDDLVSQMHALPELSGVAGTLSWARDQMVGISQQGLGASPQHYTAICAKLESLTAAIAPSSLDSSRLFQVDMVKPVRSAVLTAEVLAELLHGVELLCRFSSPVELDVLRDFRIAFTSRYDRAWVPLAEALDEDTGIGFGHSGAESSPLLRDLHLGLRNQPDRETHIPGTVLMRKLLQAQPDTELELDLEDLPPIRTAASALPDAFTVIAVLAASSAEALRKGDFRVLLKALTGPSGARLFGRFCHADPNLEQLVRGHLRQEEALQPEAVFAEIVYRPDERMGNVVSRPVLREYEIVYMGRSGAPIERQLPLSDLLIAVQNDRIVLRSLRLGKEVAPRLTTAHGFSNPKLPSVYRFLCHLQHRNVAVPIFSWDSDKTLDYLPRLRAGRVILSTARWRLSRNEIEKVAKPERAARFIKLQELRHDRKLPRWVVLEQADQTLPVDLDNVLSVDAFIHAIQRDDHANLLELFPGPDQLCLEGPEGRFCHELHVPLVKMAKSEQARETSVTRWPRIRAGRSTRIRPPGSDWVFLKLYGGAAALDDALSALGPLVRKVLEEQIAAQWFFLRYLDPQAHLRIRFHGEPARLCGELIPLLSATFAPLLNARAIHKIQFDTYEREIERYGGLEGVCASEELFGADSEAVLEILAKLSGEEGLDSRWRAALLGVDMLLTDFDFDLPAKKSLMRNLRDSYGQEFQADGKDKQILSERFRALRPALEILLDPSNSTELAFARSAFEQRSARNRATSAKLRALLQAELLDANIHDLAISYAHMHINRMMRSDWRVHELVLYDFMFRLYQGQLARKNHHTSSG